MSRDFFVVAVKVMTSSIIARSLGPENFGIWIVLLILPSYAEAFTRPKLDVAAVYFLGKGDMKLGEVASVLFLVSIAIGSVVFALGIWNAQFIMRFLFNRASVDPILLYLVVATIPFNSLCLSFLYLLLHLGDMRTYNRLVIIIQVLSSLGGIFCLLVLGWGLWGMAISSLLAFLLGTGYGFIKINIHERFAFGFNRQVFSSLYRYAAYAYIEGIINHLTHYFSSIVIVRFLALTEITFFRMAQNLTQYIARIPAALSTVLYPAISQSSSSLSESGRLTALASRVSLAISMVAVLLLAVSIYPIVRLLYGVEYMDVALHVLIILPGIGFLAGTDPLAQFFLGTGRAKLTMQLALIPFFFQIIFSFVLITMFGSIGASMVTSLTCVLLATVRSYAFMKTSHFPLRCFLLPTTEDVLLIRDWTRGRIGLSNR